MKKLLSLLKLAPKRTLAAVVAIAGAVIIPATLFAYGPVDRDTFTFESPAPYVTFNSITNNPDVGDERNFVRIKEAGDANTYSDNVNVTPGKTYQVVAYYHNNAASNLNESGVGIAHDVMLRMQMEANINAGQSTKVTGFITSPDANPTEIWDSATLTNTTAGVVDLSFVAGSAKVTSNGAVNGMTLPDSLFTTGTELGFDSLNGTLKGCNEYAGYVVFEVKVNQPNFTVQKEVSKDDGKTWSKSATVNANSTIQYRIVYTNTGTTKQTNVTVRDTLPTGISYVAGSTKVVNSATNWQYESDIDGVTTTGIDIGSYLPSGNAAVKFSAKTPKESELACGINTFKNVGRVSTPNGYKESDATVTINKECEPGKITVCELSTKKIITIDEDAYNSSKHSKDLSKCAEDKIQVCDLSTKKVISINESDFDSTKYSKDLSKCETPSELPKTGPADTILSLFGLGAIVASAAYFIASRRSVRGL